MHNSLCPIWNEVTVDTDNAVLFLSFLILREGEREPDMVLELTDCEMVTWTEIKSDAQPTKAPRRPTNAVLNKQNELNSINIFYLRKKEYC